MDEMIQRLEQSTDCTNNKPTFQPDAQIININGDLQDHSSNSLTVSRIFCPGTYNCIWTPKKRSRFCWALGHTTDAYS